jgi:hypothetical protein
LAKRFGHNKAPHPAGPAGSAGRGLSDESVPYGEKIDRDFFIQSSRQDGAIYLKNFPPSPHLT